MYKIKMTTSIREDVPLEQGHLLTIIRHSAKKIVDFLVNKRGLYLTTSVENPYILRAEAYFIPREELDRAQTITRELDELIRTSIPERARLTRELAKILSSEPEYSSLSIRSTDLDAVTAILEIAKDPEGYLPREIEIQGRLLADRIKEALDNPTPF